MGIEQRFLVSFMVDARGGAMRGCRHSGVRVIIPPRKAAMPMRITCRYLKKDKLVHAPPLMEGEALGSRILEMGPAGAKFLGPVIIEVPHFASLRGKEREIVILRSDNGETWREHTLEATEEAVQEVLNESFDGEELKQLEDLNTNRITRILTTDFPQYFAIVTRIRQEVHAIGPEGGMVSSTVVPQVQAVFPQGALTKKIKVGLQAQPIPTDLVAKLLGNRVAVSPIVTVEPRRRKFHKPITLTIPVPQASSKGMINQYSGEAPTLRLLCSITGGTTRAQWEDVTGSTPLTFVNDCVSFTTTVSARFWLMDCSNIPEATKMATELYREAIHVPFMAKFVVFSKRHQLEEARVRVFCMTDDREDKTLEQQELFVEVAKSRDVEVLEGKPQYLEFAGNLVPVTKSGDQLAFNFYAFRENRLPFTVRVKDQHADPIGRVAFMRQPKVGRGDPPQTPICNLNIALPDNIQPEPAPSEPDLLALEKKYSFLSISKADTIHKADLRLTDISNMLGTDWVGLARELEISDSDINIIKSQYPDNAPKQAIVMLRLWMQTSGNKANGNTLEKGLRKIGRDDIVNQCIFNVELVTDDIERAMAKAHLDQSGFDAFRYELGPSRDTTLNRDVSLDVSYDEQDMMKEAESAEEEEENQRSYQDKTRREQHTADMSPTYESEEKKYAGEEKIVTEEKITKEEMKDGSAVTVTTTTTSVVAEPVTESKKEAKDKTIITEKVVPEDQKAPPAKEAEKVEDKVPKPEKKEEKPIVLDKAEEKVVEKVEEVVVEQKVEEKPVVKVVEKSAEVGEKAKDASEKLEEKAPEVPPASLDEAQKAGTTTATEVITGPDGTTTSSTTTTTERRSFTTADDGTVKEHIVIEKKTTSFVDGMEKGEDKSEILLKLGEELGRLDEQLEERFKEKRKAVEPEVAQEEVRETTVVAKRREGQAEPTSQVVVEHSHQPTNLSATITSTTTTTSITPTPDGFTQASVESRQMSSTGGTTEVSTKGTAITTTQPVIGDETVMQMGQGTHEATQIAEHQTTTVSQEQASSGLPTPGTKAGSAHGKSKLTEADLAVLESMVIAQEAEVEEMAFAHDQAEAQAKAQEEQLRKKGQQQKPKVKGQKKQDQAKGQLQQGKVEEQALLDKAQAQIHQEKIKGQLKDKKSAQPEVKNETQSKAGQVQQSQEGQKLPSNVESLIQPTQTQQVQLGGLAQSTQGQVESLIQPTQFQSQAQQVQVESLIQPTQVKGQAQQVQVGSLIQPTQVKGQAEIQFENLSQPPLMKSQAQSQAETKDQMQQGQVEYILQQTSGLVQQPQTGEAIQGHVGLTQQLRVNGHQQQIQTQVQREGQSPQDKVQALIQSQGQVQTLKQQETPSKQIQPETTTKIQQSTTRVVSPGKGHAPTLASAATPAGQTKQQQFGDLTKRVADVASTMASTLESITAVAEGLEGSHLSSDEGEEQLMLMRDSPRWEDEEIQAEETDEPRAIKAEIKLLVKTTEVGKESIEIRSIREFVESDEKNLSGFGGIVPSPVPEAGRVTPQGDRVYTLQRGSPSARTPSPRFVRQQQSSPVSSYIQPTHDEFDLMAQVRDVVQPDSGAGARQAPGSSGGRKSKTGK